MQSSNVPAPVNTTLVAKSEANAIENVDKKSFVNKLASKTLKTVQNLPMPKVVKDGIELWGKPLEDIVKDPLPLDVALKDELAFVKNPSFEAFVVLVQEFEDAYRVVGHPKFDWVKEISVPKDGAESNKTLPYTPPKIAEQEKWFDKNSSNFFSKKQKADHQTEKRHQKIEEMGLGYGGKMSTVIGKSKASAFFTKNNFTLRGTMFKSVDKACPKTVDEIMPRYGYRKSAHVGVRTTQFTLYAIVASLGFGLIPVTFGLSRVISSHVNNAITVGGEVITRKIAGAEKKKLTTHAGVRGAQLEVPLFIPIVGDFIYYGDYIVFGAAAAGIVSSTIADSLYSKFSTRYQSTVNLDDMGNSRCLSELNHRIDYLSHFLLPYGEYLLFKETDLENRRVLQDILKDQFKKLNKLEKKKLKSLNYYLLALAEETIPEPQRAIIQKDCENDDRESHVNTHKDVRSCSAYLIDQEAVRNKNLEENSAAMKSQPGFYHTDSSLPVFSVKKTLPSPLQNDERRFSREMRK